MLYCKPSLRFPASSKQYGAHHNEILALCSAPGWTLIHTPEGGLPLCLKFGPLVLNEARTQEYMYNYATTDPHAPRIPKIYDSFGGHQGYIVMEFIDAPTVRECLQTDRDPPKYLYDKVAEAVKWLLFRPMPPSAQLAGSAQHLIFVDQVAPRPFVSAKGLEIYFNKVCRKPFRWPRSRAPTTVNFSHEPLTFYHSVSAANCLYDVNTDQLYIVDFQHVGIYPRSFASLPFYVQSNGFVKAIVARVNYWRSPNIAAMCQARYMFH